MKTTLKGIICLKIASFMFANVTAKGSCKLALANVSLR